MDLEGLIDNLPRDDEAFEQVIELLVDVRRLDEHRPSNLSKLVPKVLKLKALEAHGALPVRKYGPLTEWISFYEAELLDAAAWLRDTFGLELESALKDVGLPLSGHYPELKAGLFSVVLDFATYRTTLWYGLYVVSRNGNFGW